MNDTYKDILITEIWLGEILSMIANGSPKQECA